MFETIKVMNFMKIFVHIPHAFNVFYGCLRTSSFIWRLLCRKKREKTASERQQRWREEMLRILLLSVIVPQGKFLSFLTLNLSFFIFFCFPQKDKKWEEKSSCFSWGAAAAARHQPRKLSIPHLKQIFLPFS